MAEKRNPLDLDEIENCMRCGFCLPSCPTYRETGLEYASPRGRIALMKAVATGQMEVTEAFDDAMYLCLGCRACETACPAGVQYGHLIEGAREVVESSRPRSPWVRLARRATMGYLFPRPDRMQRIGSLIAMAQRTGLQRRVGGSRWLKRWAKPLAEMQVALPEVAPRKVRRMRQPVVPAATNTGSARFRVGVLTGCVMDAVFFETNQNTARVLSAAGCDVVFVEGQTCCGALHAHSGDKAGAIALAKKNIEAFERANVDVYVNNAGGCGAALKEYGHWLKDDAAWADRAKRFSNKMKDFNELLATLPLPRLKPLTGTVTYQDSCHLAHGQGVRLQPRQLLRQIPGLRYVELPGADECCGSAGIYNITQYDMSMQVLDRKMETVARTNVDIIATANPGCLLQMRLGIHRAGLEHRMQAVHIADLLAQALAE
ncbi:MAG: (Fe-S)-binding protein [Alicyclobacillus sp.]|nr:(Fe-S)-binding protein [Alicyclobacillus sp.]